MPIISNSLECFGKYHLIFSGNELVVCGLEADALDSDSLMLTAENLPDISVLELCLSQQVASDWYTETGLDYTALMLETDSPLPPGCALIPLRHFFWVTKTLEERNRGEPSFIGGLAARAHGFLELRRSYRFCPECGRPLADDETFTARKCTGCGKLLFPRIETAIIVIVSRGDEVLLTKNRTRLTDIYSCVAGFVEHGESLEQCVAREVLEETNISIKNIRYVGSQAWPFPDQLMLAFTADYESGEIKIQEEELSDAGWFKRSALPKIPRPGSVAYNLITGKFSR